MGYDTQEKSNSGSQALLDAAIPDGTIVYGAIHRQTDMTKWCSFYVVFQGGILDATVSIARIIGRKVNAQGHMAVKACGISPIDQTVDNLARTMGRNLTASKL
jgi:hypothetical protein